MKVQTLPDSTCEALRPFLAGFVDAELSEAKQREVEQHLKICLECAHLAADQASLKTALHEAGGAEAAPRSLLARVEGDLERARRRSRRPLYVAVAAMLVLGVGWQVSLAVTGYAPHQVLAHEWESMRLRAQVGELLGLGLSNHVTCAVYRKFPPQPPPQIKTEEELGENWAPVAMEASEAIGRGWELRLAHRCRYRDREFVHMAFLRGGEMTSVMLTKQREGESLAAEAEPADVLDELPLFAAAAERFQIVGFEAEGYFGYVISEQSPAANIELAKSVIPAIRRRLRLLETQAHLSASSASAATKYRWDPAGPRHPTRSVRHVHAEYSRAVSRLRSA